MRRIALLATLTVLAVTAMQTEEDKFGFIDLIDEILKRYFDVLMYHTCH